MTTKKYPFKEGDTYYTIENSKVVKSCWDCISEEIHFPDKVYYTTREEAELANSAQLNKYKIEVYKNNCGIYTMYFEAVNDKEAVKELHSYINPYDNENSNTYEMELYCTENDMFIDSINTNYYT